MKKIKENYELTTKELTFYLKAKEGGPIPPYFAALFRGVLGKHLYDLSCIRPHVKCDYCPFNASCPYGSMFEPTSAAIAPQFTSKMEKLPPPFVIESPIFLKGKLDQNESIQVRIKLFGYAINYTNEVIRAVEKVCENGIGSRRIKLELTKNLSNKSLSLKENNTFSIERVERNSIDEILIIFRTPLRIQRSGKQQRKLTKELFLINCLRRMEFLLSLHGKEIDLPLLEELDADFSMKRIEEKWRNLRRYSGSQKRAVPISGITGIYELEGNLERILPILKFCSYVHIGKQTVFGLGKFDVFVEY